MSEMGQFMTMADFQNALDRIRRAIQGTNAMNKFLGEHQLGGTYNDPSANVHTDQVVAISRLEEQYYAFTNPNAKKAVQISTREQRRAAFTFWKLPKMLVDLALIPEEGRTQEFIPQFVLDDEDE